MTRNLEKGKKTESISAVAKYDVYLLASALGLYNSEQTYRDSVMTQVKGGVIVSECSAESNKKSDFSMEEFVCQEKTERDLQQEKAGEKR